MSKFLQVEGVPKMIPLLLFAGAMKFLQLNNPSPIPGPLRHTNIYFCCISGRVNCSQVMWGALSGLSGFFFVNRISLKTLYQLLF